jgi:hypothetical protein
MLRGKINFEQIIEAKMIHDVLGHYSRFDVLSLNLNEERLGPIHYPNRAGSYLDRLGATLEGLREKLDEIEGRLDSMAEGKRKERE